MQDIVEQLRVEIARVLDISPEDIDPDADLTDEGLDSIRMMGLVERIHAAGYSVDFADLAADPRLNAWIVLLSPTR